VSAPAVLLTGAGKRYDIVSCFSRLTKTVVADPSPLAPAQYAAHVRSSVPLIGDPGYIPALERLCEQHGMTILLVTNDGDTAAHLREQVGGLFLTPSAPSIHCLLLSPTRRRQPTTAVRRYDEWRRERGRSADRRRRSRQLAGGISHGGLAWLLRKQSGPSHE